MIRGRIVVDSERCKGCGLCVGVCPQGSLALSETFNAAGYHPVRLADPPSCTGCAVCAIICPDVALTVYRQKKEPRAGSRDTSRAPSGSRLAIPSSARQEVSS